MHTVTFITLGCKLNQAETAMIIQDFEARGYRVVSQDEPADVGVINTCTVTGRSASKCRQAIRKLKKQNSAMTLIITGCYPQVDPEEVATLGGVDYVLGVEEKLKLFDFFTGPGKQAKPQIAVGPVRNIKTADEHDVGVSPEQTRAFLKIQNGCDRRCAYCIVPIARGPSRSTTANFVIQQARSLVEKGYKEIVLTGVHVGDYGKDLNPNRDSLLPELLESIIQLPGPFRLRFSSTDPSDLTEKLIQTVAKHPQICRHFHIPIQSGNDEILNAMNRKYTTGEVANAILMIQDVLGVVGIGADVIVGFPGESESLFESTYEFIRQQPFSYLHVFPFSERPGTVAATMEPKVPPKARALRAKRLRELGFNKKQAWLSQWVGQTVEVLMESTPVKGKMGGFTSEYARVEVPFEAKLSNQFVPIAIEQNVNGTLHGKVLAG